MTYNKYRQCYISNNTLDALQMPTAQFKCSSQAVNCPFTDTAHTFYEANKRPSELKFFDLRTSVF